MTITRARVPWWPRRPMVSWTALGLVLPAVEEGDPAPLLGPGVATPGVMSPVLDP